MINKFSHNETLLIYLLEAMKRLTSLRKFKDLISEPVLSIIFQVISTCESHKVAILGLQILDGFLKADCRELIRKNNPISLIVKLLSKFRNDTVLSYHACGFLSKILEKEDVDSFLKIMKIKSNTNMEKELEQEFLNNTMLNEIKDNLINQDEESINSLKKNLTRILILMSKDKDFLQLLKDINSLDIFVGLLKNDLDVYSNKDQQDERTQVEINMIGTLLPDFLKLVLSLLKNYDLEEDMEVSMDSRKSISQKLFNKRFSAISIQVGKQDIAPTSQIKPWTPPQLLKDICYCLAKSLNYFTGEKEIVHEIVEFVISKDKSVIDLFIKELEKISKYFLMNRHQSNYRSI